jgi:hypothetical protein
MSLLQRWPQLAAEDFGKAIAVNPASAYAHNGRGYARVLLGQVEEGLQDAETAVRFLFLIFTIGLFPHFFIYGVSKVIGLFSGNLSHMHPVPYFVTLMQKVGFTSWGIIILAFLVYRVKKFITSKSVSTVRPTWGCGYETASSKLQYTSTSFSRSFRELVNPLLKVHRYEDKIKTIVPGKVRVEMHIIDKLEFYFIDEPVKHLRSFIGRFKFLQNGSVQFYILYGVVFILIAITIPILIRATYQLFALFKQL